VGSVGLGASAAGVVASVAGVIGCSDMLKPSWGVRNRHQGGF
jgi:hypothetical protein